MSIPKKLPPLDGTLTVLPGFVNFHAEHNPDLPWAKFPSASQPEEIESITFLEFSRATHRIAHALRHERAGKDGEVVAVLIHCDSILYLALLAGMVRAGLVVGLRSPHLTMLALTIHNQPFPMSPRNSPEAICEMLVRTSCRKLITQPSLSALSSAVQAMMTDKQSSAEVVQLPALHDIFPSLANGDCFVESYPPSSEAPKPTDTVLYLHSSGSTGFPKPIPQTNQAMLEWCLTCAYLLLLDSCRSPLNHPQLLYTDLEIVTYTTEVQAYRPSTRWGSTSSSMHLWPVANSLDCSRPKLQPHQLFRMPTIHSLLRNSLAVMASS